MKTLKEQLNENIINESFVSIGLTIIVTIILAKISLKGIKAISQIYKGIKESINTISEYSSAVKELNILLEPYKDELLDGEWSSKLFDENKIITTASARKEGASMLYGGIVKDVKKILSKEDFDKYIKIIQPIIDTNIMLDVFG
jgi:hypothetical protein